MFNCHAIRIIAPRYTDRLICNGSFPKRQIAGLGPLMNSPESIDKAIKSWEKQVESNKLSSPEKIIHESHLQALKVRHMLYRN